MGSISSSKVTSSNKCLSNIFFIKNPLLISAKNTHNMIKYKIPFCEHVIVKIS